MNEWVVGSLSMDLSLYISDSGKPHTCYISNDQVIRNPKHSLDFPKFEKCACMQACEPDRTGQDLRDLLHACRSVTAI